MAERDVQTQVNHITFWRSIGGRILIWTLVLALLPLLVVGWLTNDGARVALEESISGGLESTAQSKNIYIEDWISDTLRFARNIATITAVRGDTFASTPLGVEDIRLYRDRPIQSEAFQAAYGAARETADVFVETYRRIDSVYIVDRNDIVQVATRSDIIPELANMRDIETVDLDAILAGPYLSSVKTSVDGETSIMVAGHPIYSPNGELIGAVVLRIMPTSLESLLADRTGLGETGETYVVDLHTSRMITDSRFSETESGRANDVIDTFAIRQAQAGVETGMAQYADYRGVPVLGVWNLLPDMNWLLMAEIDHDEAFAPVNDLAALNLFVALAAAGIIVVISYFVARSISRPIVHVAEAAANLSAGNFSERVEVTEKSEIGLLGTAFNHMAADLQTMIQAERESKAYLEAVVGEYMTFIERVARGNLRTRLDLNGSHDWTGNDDLYQLGDNLNRMVESLSEMANRVRETSASILTATTQIEAATTQQTATATEQDAAVTQTVATVEEVRATVLQTSERVQAVSSKSQESVAVSRGGQQAVVDSIGGMTDIRERVNDIAEAILALSERTQQIGEIIETVNGIADQSKLLALNASIEAARAGEEGRGFAVVAMEVRQLAEQSREATARVGDILSEIQQTTNAAVMVTEEGSKGAEYGVGLVERAGEAIRNLAATIEEAAQAALQIAASTEQQTNGMDQLSTAMQQIKQATAQTVAGTRQTEQSLRELNALARDLSQAAARYEL